jgi:protein involved in polysaccharide export with SLBB domain
MRFRLLRPLLTAAAVFAFAPLVGRAGAQQIPTLPGGQRPTPEQAQELLRSRPDLISQLQQRLQSSGLTPDQVRARLRAEGYPESLLDAYLPGGGGRGSATDTLSSGTVLNAMEILGVADSLDVSILRGEGADSARGRDARGRTARPLPVPTGARDFVVDTVTRLPGARLPDTTGVVEFIPLPGDSTRFIRRVLRRDQRDSATGPADTSRFARDSARLARDSGLAVFGLDLFRNASTTLFDPNLAGPVDRSYRLGPGDRLVLLLTGDVETTASLQVTREGFVVVPQVGQIFVNNLTLGDFERVLGARLARVYSGVRSGATRFSVSVARLRTNQVFVVGDVLRPGSYRVSSAGTALTALYAAGGPSEAGSLRRVEVRRGGRTAAVLDVYDYLTRGDASRDARLESGDVVFVPPRLARVRALGEVLRPGTYEVRPGETLADLVRTAGGLTALAAQRIVVERVLPAGQRAQGASDRVVLTANAALGDVPTLPLANGDVVRVGRVGTARVGNRVTVRGNVVSPGPLGLRDGMRVSEALRAAGLKPDTYLGRVLVTRLERDSSRVQLRAVLRDVGGAVVNDFALREDDDVEVFSVASFRPERSVSIGGAVRAGGRFQYRAGMSLRDLVLLAGGLREGALLTEAEIARLPAARAGGVTASTIRVRLDSTYLFEREAGRAYARVPGVPAAASGAPDVLLEPYDNVLILRQPDFELQRTVFLGGEVRYPGRYALRRKTERLSDVIARAGGLTTEGYADGVVFYRARDRTGRIGIDLPRVLANARTRDNFVLQDGDSVVVPSYNPVVRVTGAVNAPAAVAFVPGRDADDYVNAAGGPGRDADTRRIYVRQPNGKVEGVRRRRLAPDRVPEVRAGAEVVVPTRALNEQVTSAAQTIGLFAQIAGTLAAVITAIAIARPNR